MEVVALKQPCSQCKGSGVRVVPAGEYARAMACSCQESCPKCEGTGRVTRMKDGYGFLAPCECQKVRQGIALFNQAHLPARCVDHDFDSLEPQFSELTSAVMIAQGVCHTFVRGQTREGLLITGPVGTGKTHLLASILRYLTLEARVPSRYVEISFLYSEIRRGFSEGRSSLQIVGPLADVPVLAIDELGKGKASPFELETIDELVSRRYNAGLPTFFATNYAFDPKSERKAFTSTRDRMEESKHEQSLKDRIGERVYSRLQQMCRLLEFPAAAQDFRRSFKK